MMSVHCEIKRKNEYTLGIDTGGMGDVASMVDASLGMYTGYQSLHIN